MKDWQKALAAFVASYVIMYILQFLLSAVNLASAWSNNPAFYILPIIGFFAVFFSMDWFSEFFETSIPKKAWFLAVLVIISLLAWHFALVFYFQNNVYLELKQNQSYQSGAKINFSQNCSSSEVASGVQRNEAVDSLGIAQCLAVENDLSQLKNSPFLYLIISLLFGWIAAYVVRKD